MSKCKVLAFLMAMIIAVNGLSFAPFSVDEIITAEAAEYGEEYLTGVNLDIYNALRPIIEEIAAGNETSTVMTISLEYSYSELGARSYFQAKNSISRTIDKTLVSAYLIYDLPSELYWMDKTVDVELDEDYAKGDDSITVTLTFSFYVSVDYQGEGEFEVDAEKIALANTAMANALEIVDKYKDESDLDKLTAYKDEICELVSYETDYEDADYGDIWQIIWVFDGDDSTNVVCEGYSKALQYLCDLSEFDADVECYTVTGYTSNGVTTGSHMWNIIRVDGNSYMVDVTNSDADSLGEDGDLFMVSEDDAVMSNSFGYIVTASGYNIMYTYDTITLRMYSTTVLTLGPITSGDVNGDGFINYLDAMTVLRYDAELVELSDDELTAGDVNGDGCVDSLDAILILRYDAGLIDSFE